jgi:hypothetical protein
MIRQRFYVSTAVLAILLAGWSIWHVASASDTTRSSEPHLVPDPGLPAGAKIDYINPNSPEFQLPQPAGESYVALVPDTLDLAERARLSINGMTGMLNPNVDEQLYFIVAAMADPPTMLHTGASDLNTVGKFLEVLPLMRTMCGSKQNLEAERVLLLNTLRDQGPDGMLYLPVGGRPYILPDTFDSNSGWPGRDTGIRQVGHLGYGASRSVGALMIYAQLDPRGPWKEAVRRLNKAFEDTVIVDGDLAYNFEPYMAPGDKVVKPEHPPEKILGGQSAWVIRYLMMYDRVYHDPRAADLGHKMANYNMGPLGYFAEDGRFLDDVTTDMSHGGPCAHFHTHVMNILAALDVVRKTNDRKLLDRALKAYEWAKTPAAQGSNLIGYFPEVVFAEPGYINSEICEVSDMICAAIDLSRLQIDRWDDADRWTRNMLAEAQMTDTNWRQDGHIPANEYVVLKDSPEGRYTTDHVMERSVGAFSGWPAVNDWVGRAHNDKSVTTQNCCTGSGARALFYVWRNMLDYDNGTLRLNLLFNRASQWADIDSYIPYEGRVDVKVKQDLKGLEIRLPQWVTPNEATASVDGVKRPLSFDGRYAKVGAVKSGQTVQFTFPIFESVVKESIQGTEYTFVVRGNDVVSVDPPGKYRPFYQRAKYRLGYPQYRKVNRFVSAENFDWW